MKLQGSEKQGSHCKSVPVSTFFFTDGFSAGYLNNFPDYNTVFEQLNFAISKWS